MPDHNFDIKEHHYAEEPAMVPAFVSNALHADLRETAARMHMPLSRLTGILIEQGMERLKAVGEPVVD